MGLCVVSGGIDFRINIEKMNRIFVENNSEINYGGLKRVFGF